MLPSHLLDPTKRKNELPSHTRLGSLPPAPPPSLCITGAMPQLGRWTVEPDVVLSYCVFRPRSLHSNRKPPLIVVHGGPSIPSNYLLPLVNVITDRSIVFFDQWGCGKSSRPSPISTSSDRKRSSMFPPFSIPTMVEHIRQLIEECWKLKHYHLLGHSWGGILSYEYLKLKEQHLHQLAPSLIMEKNPCHSLVLASTPSSARLVQDECRILMNQLTNITGVDGGSNREDEAEKSTITDEDSGGKDTMSSVLQSDEFRQTHECRLPNIPLALMDATAQAGPTPWRGIPAILDYVAMPVVVVDDENVETKDDKDSNDDNDSISKKEIKIEVPTLLLRGEYDFCTEKCMVGWNQLVSVEKQSVLADSGTETNSSTCSIVSLTNCSHYSMLEDEKQFGKVILEFLQRHDNT